MRLWHGGEEGHVYYYIVVTDTVWDSCPISNYLNDRRAAAQVSK